MFLTPSTNRMQLALSFESTHILVEIISHFRVYNVIWERFRLIRMNDYECLEKAISKLYAYMYTFYM